MKLPVRLLKQGCVLKKCWRLEILKLSENLERLTGKRAILKAEGRLKLLKRGKLMNFVMSYSCGKDSALALFRMIQGGHKPIALLTTINKDQERSWFHGVKIELLHEISRSLQIPIILCECPPERYGEAFEQSLGKAKQMGAEACVFGDIDLVEHREWNQERCDNVGLACLLPLWQENREALTHEVIDNGFKALINIVRSDILDESFLGKELSKSLIALIKTTGADVCGENGEYHTFIYDGPIFTRPISFELKEIVDFGSHKAINVVKKTIETGE